MYIMEGMDDIIHSSMKTISDGCMVGDGEEGRYVAAEAIPGSNQQNTLQGWQGFIVQHCINLRQKR